MKDNKNKPKSMGRILAKMALWLVIGGVIGYAAAFLVFAVKGDTADAMRFFYNGYLQYAAVSYTHLTLPTILRV